MTNLGDILSATDAFGRQRVSAPVTIFDSQMTYDEQPLLWLTSLTGSGSITHNANKSAVELDVTTASGDEVIRQTRRYLRYQPGKSQFIALSFLMATAASNLRQRIGYFDAENGIFLETDDTTVNVVRRSKTSGSVVDDPVAQASWNIDPMDGGGPSGETLDLTKTQILVIDLQWLGEGRVRIGFDIAGQIFYVHEFLNANVLAVPYMTTADLPLRYEITAKAALAGAAELLQICQTVISEGGAEAERAFLFSADNGTLVRTTVTTTPLPVISIRPKTTFNSIPNRSDMLPLSFELLSVDRTVLWQVIFDGTLTGASFADVNASSGMQKDEDASSISGGIVIDSGYLISGGGVKGALAFTEIVRELYLTLDIAGANPTPVSLVMTNLGSGNAAGRGAIKWSEAR